MARPQSSASTKAVLGRRQHLAALLTGKQYRQALTELQERTADEWSRDERYAYGYALLQSGDTIGALATWAPLLTKMGPEFDGTCRVVAQQAFCNVAALQVGWDKLSLAELLPLYATARALLPEHPLTHEFRRRLQSQLWAAGDQGSLSNLLKLLESSREPTDYVTYVTVPRLRLRLRAPKCLAEAVALIPPYLTAAGSYVLKRGDVCSLADGLDSLAAGLQRDLGESMACTAEELTGLASWVACEVGAMVAVSNHAGAVIPDAVLFAPSHFVMLDTKRTAAFRAFLANLPAELRAPYEVGNAALGMELLRVLTGQESAKVERRLLQRASEDLALPSYLRLALFERALSRGDEIAVRIAQTLLHELPVIKTGFVTCISAAVYAMMKAQHISTAHSMLIEILSETIPAGTEDADLRNIASRFVLALLSRKRPSSEGDWRILARLALTLTDAPKTRIHLQTVLDRVQVAEEFLDEMQSAKGERRIKKILKGKDHAELKALLALVADAGRLTFPWGKFWQHHTDEGESPVDRYLEVLERVLEHRCLQPSALGLAQQENPVAAMDCVCQDCVTDLLGMDLPPWLAGLGIDVLQMPNPEASVLTVSSDAAAPAPLDLDPFAVLGVGEQATKAEILAATMRRMREAPARMAEFRRAQAALFDAKTRINLEFGRAFVHSAPTTAGSGSVVESGGQVDPAWQPSQVLLLDAWRRCGATRS